MRCYICDFSESAPSLYRGGTTDAYKGISRQKVVYASHLGEEICTHCLQTMPKVPKAMKEL